MIPVWQTLSDIGKYTSGSVLNYTLKTNQVTTFTILNGGLPRGLSLSASGILSGTIGNTITAYTSVFTVRATNALSEISDRTFYIAVTPSSSIGFQNSGLIITTKDSTWVNYQLPINNPVNEAYEVWLLSGNLPSGLYVTKSGMIKGYPSIPINQLTNTPETTVSTFSLAIDTNTGRDVKQFSIRVDVAMSRPPVILNTTPPLDYISSEFAPYYNNGDFGLIKSGDDIALKIIGKDFNGSILKYAFTNLPAGLIGDVNTGWVRGIINANTTTYSRYKFTAYTYKADQPTVRSADQEFSFVLSKNMNGNITWSSPTLSAYTGEQIAFKISATASTNLTYSIVSGALPSNLQFKSNGEIVGQIALQLNPPMPKNTTKEFVFTVLASSTIYPEIQSTKTFTFKVTQSYSTAYDIVYFKNTPSIADRQLVDSLLADTTLIPDNLLFRPTDKNFGKSKTMRVNFLYGINSVSFDKYYAAVNLNHYPKSLTFGAVKTAKATDDAGNTIYEVVYVELVDDIAPVNKVVNGYYPNSLHNMQQQIINTIGQNQTQYLLPRWMSSQQSDGSVLGPIPAWVICHTIPGGAATIKQNIDTVWKENLKLINFKIDRYYIDKAASFNWNSASTTPYWTSLPAGYPIPVSDERDFYVLFPFSNIKGNQ